MLNGCARADRRFRQAANLVDKSKLRLTEPDRPGSMQSKRICGRRRNLITNRGLMRSRHESEFRRPAARQSTERYCAQSCFKSDLCHGEPFPFSRCKTDTIHSLPQMLVIWATASDLVVAHVSFVAMRRKGMVVFTAAVTRHSNRGKCTLRPRYCTQIAEFRACLYSIRGQSGWRGELAPRKTSLSG